MRNKQVFERLVQQLDGKQIVDSGNGTNSTIHFKHRGCINGYAD